MSTRPHNAPDLSLDGVLVGSEPHPVLCLSERSDASHGLVDLLEMITKCNSGGGGETFTGPVREIRAEESL